MRRLWLLTGVAAVLSALAIGLAATALLGDRHPVSAGEARAVLDSYLRLYTREDVRGIEALLAPGFQRRVGGGPPQPRHAAVARLRRIFSEPQAPRYALDDMRVTTDGSGATARGRFLAEGRNLYGTGAVSFHLARHGDRVLIDWMAIVPDVNQQVPVSRHSLPAVARIAVRTTGNGTLPRGTLIAQGAFRITRYEPERFYRMPLNAEGRRIGRGEPYEIRIHLRERGGRRSVFNVVSELD